MVRFDVISQPNPFIPNVQPSDRHFYQAEVLIKTNLPSKFIKFCKRKAAIDFLTSSIDLAPSVPTASVKYLSPSLHQIQLGERGTLSCSNCDFFRPGHVSSISPNFLRPKIRRRDPSLRHTILDSIPETDADEADDTEVERNYKRSQRHCPSPDFVVISEEEEEEMESWYRVLSQNPELQILHNESIDILNFELEQRFLRL